MRKHYHGTLWDGTRRIIANALIRVYLANSIKLARIYSEKYNLKSVWGARTKTDEGGVFDFFIETDDYRNKEQSFKIESFKKGFVNMVADEINI